VSSMPKVHYPLYFYLDKQLSGCYNLLDFKQYF